MAASKDSGWVDVAFTSTTKAEVTSGVKDNAFLKVAKEQGFVLLNQDAFPKGMVLEPSKRYEFRVAAVNSMGVGPWSPVTRVRTLTPGAPHAPTNIKISISKEDGGPIIYWDVPPSQYPISDYGVFVAIKCENAPPPSDTITPKNAIFKQVYEGSRNMCHVAIGHLKDAVVDKTGGTGKDAVIFRITSRNAAGYGPATQVRWVQDK